ncbi:leucine-rich repeat-containing protein 74A, partial [Exaiptasia diaphana]|uniref:Uncharacterized protein n=1 Tax=Exaiptasia diaphana TaxID=2652724 RepID=A0A913WVK0_EXADI
MIMLTCLDGERKGKTRVSFQSRFAERSTRTGYKAMPFIPGSFSTMISVEESDENKSEGDGDPLQAPASPCFADVLSSGESSEYDTDLEEEFPVNNKEFDPSGKTLYVKMCKDKDLVPVSYFTERLKESEIIMRHHGLGTIGTLPLSKSLKKNTFIEKIDLTDN